MSDEDERQGGLSRARLVAAALELVDSEGLDALSMRGLADRLGVKAASLYWHVRDRRELLELLAEALLGRVPAPRSGAGWREAALSLCWSMDAVLEGRRDSARMFLEVPDTLQRSPVLAQLVRLLEAGGLGPPEARDVASMMLTHVVVSGVRAAAEPAGRLGKPASLAIDTGSRGVEVRAGHGVDGLFSVPRDASAASPAVVRGDRVIVRRLRGVSRGALELNPDLPWQIRVQGPTWNTLLDLTGLDVRGIHLDSSAAKVEIVLPPPQGEVPINVSSGVVGVHLRRPPDVAVVADISTGAVQVKLDEFAVAASTGDLHWESRQSASRGDRYALRLNSGCVRVTLEEDPSLPAAVSTPAAGGEHAVAGSALEVVLDGISARRAQK